MHLKDFWPPLSGWLAVARQVCAEFCIPQKAAPQAEAAGAAWGCWENSQPPRAEAPRHETNARSSQQMSLPGRPASPAALGV